jgi:FkbM family methyltransferase
MSLRALSHSFFRFFGFKFEKTISSFGNKYAFHNIRKNDYQIDGKIISFKKLNLEIPIARAAPILERYQEALNLKQKADFNFSWKNETLIAANQKLEFKINDEEELFILAEVFLEGSYNLLSPTTKRIALIDVGMNVGITSLFYASKENVDQVFSFEPFVPTFILAKENISLNEKYQSKIHASNFGLAKSDGEMQIDYSPKQKGRMGFHGLPESSFYKSKELSQQTIQLKNAADEFFKIKNTLSNYFVVCKIDCEGAEYEIIESLKKGDVLSFINVFFIEWHEIIPSEIVSTLASNNYNVINTSFKLLNSGMIYAVKSEVG